MNRDFQREKRNGGGGYVCSIPDSFIHLLGSVFVAWDVQRAPAHVKVTAGANIETLHAFWVYGWLDG